MAACPDVGSEPPPAAAALVVSNAVAKWGIFYGEVLTGRSVHRRFDLGGTGQVWSQGPPGCRGGADDQR